MNEFISYLIKTFVCTFVFYSLYFITLRKSTFFKLNRSYLLITLCLSFIIPLLNISVNSIKTIETNLRVNYFQEIVIYAKAPVKTIQLDKTNIAQVIPILFLSISILLSSIYLVSVIRINILKYKAVKLKLNKIKLFITVKDIPAFSFIKSIFVSKAIYHSENFNDIFNHEKIHIKNYHSIDLILLSILKSIFWINPFIYLYEKSLRENHEFTADNLIIKQGVEKEDYKKLMLNSTIKNLFPAPVNSFSMSMIKKRFKMINRNNSKKTEYIKYLMIIPLTAILLIAFACNNKSENPVKTEDKYAKYEYTCCFDDNGKIIPMDSARRFTPDYLFYDKIENVRDLPEEAIKAGISTAVVNLNTVRDKNGKLIYVKAINGKIAGEKWKNKLGYGLEEKAENILRNLDDFKLVYNPNGIPAFEHDLIRVQFGDIDVWRAKEEPETSIRMKRKETFDNDPAKNLYNFKFEKIQNFIAQNIKYPVSAVKNNISGTVFVKFNINNRGKIFNINISKGINKDFDSEVLRVMNLVNNSGVDIGYGDDYEINLPVKFQLK